MKQTGIVSLVGAGPGDPELISVRGRKRLEAADVVVYDDLAGTALLEFCRADCERIYVGKRCGEHAAAQAAIIEILIAQARLGRKVVRLKGGDPLIFGRGGEEIEALQREEIDFEVVPGITAACAAAAAGNVPLTHRDQSSAVVFITGHESTKPESANDWSAYAKLGATLCIYMGGRRLSVIARQLVAGGMNADTPVAVVSRASRADQQILFFRLADLPGADVSAVPLPALAIIGEVARHASQIQDVAALSVRC